MRAFFVAVASVFIAAQVTFASVQINDIVRLKDGPGTGNGGEFILQKKTGSSFSTLYNTFCVEISEGMKFNTAYKVANISLQTEQSGHSLSVAAAWLYSQFIKGFNSGADFNIGGYSYDFDGPSRANDARSLQLAIWEAMGWNTSGQSGSSAVKTKATNYLNAALSQADPDGNYFNVRIMNLVKVNSRGVVIDSTIQDQLVIVPEASTIAVWSVLSLVGAGVAYRKRTAKA